MQKRGIKALGADGILWAAAGATAVCVAIGFAASLAGFGKDFLALPHSFTFAACFAGVTLCGITWVAIPKVTRWSDGGFQLSLFLFCLVSRCVVVFAFPHYAPTGDEDYLHRFVVTLAEKGLRHDNLAALSSWYDYPVWLSRAFPIYLPIRIFFGSSDLFAVRVCNALLGAGSVIFVYLILKSLIPQSYARVAAWGMAIYPYHVVDVLSYDPQIPGTFFFLAGIWLATLLIFSGPVKVSKGNVLRALLLGLAIWLAGVQRGGIDALLVVTIVVGCILYFWTVRPSYSLKPCALLLAIAFVVWMAPRSALNEWIAANDAHHLRSHVLGFMTRGWNLDSLGEYLPRYEELDVSAPPNEKSRVLEAVLVTEVVRRPLDTLAVIPPVKIGKFMAIGFGASTETGLEQGGYRQTANLLKVLTAVAALLTLFLCELGLLVVLQRRLLRNRLVIPLLLTVLSATAITLIWETSPRYSDPIHFALVALAAIGLLSLRKKSQWRKKIVFPIVTKVALLGMVIVLAWILCWSIVFIGALRAKNRQFADLRSAGVTISGAPSQMEPVNRRTTAWEDIIDIPPSATLPVEVRITLPVSPLAVHKNGWSFSVWAPESSSQCLSCEFKIENGAEGESATLGDLARMKRFVAIDPGGDSRAVGFKILPDAQNLKVKQPLRIAIGYLLPE